LTNRIGQWAELFKCDWSIPFSANTVTRAGASVRNGKESFKWYLCLFLAQRYDLHDRLPHMRDIA